MILTLSVMYIHLESQQNGWCPELSFRHRFFIEFDFAHQSHHKRLLPAFARFPTIQLYFRRKCGAEYASGVSGACYSCNQSYRRCIYSMCCVLCTCVGMHMPCRPRDYAGALKMCDHSILRALKNKSSGGRSLAGVRDDTTRWCGACWSLLERKSLIDLRRLS